MKLSRTQKTKRKQQKLTGTKKDVIKNTKEPAGTNRNLTGTKKQLLNYQEH